MARPARLHKSWVCHRWLNCYSRPWMKNIWQTRNLPALQNNVSTSRQFRVQLCPAQLYRDQQCLARLLHKSMESVLMDGKSMVLYSHGFFNIVMALGLCRSGIL